MSSRVTRLCSARLSCFRAQPGFRHRPALRARPLSAQFPPAQKRRGLQRLRSFPNGLLRGMLHGNEHFELVLLAGNFGNLLPVSITASFIAARISSLVALCPAVGLWNNVARMPSITWAASSSSIANVARPVALGLTEYKK